jgi:hypothetical protein
MFVSGRDKPDATPQTPPLSTVEQLLWKPCRDEYGNVL